MRIKLKDMDKEQMQNKFETFGQKQYNVLLAKGDDYAGSDRLKNFKVAGNCAGVTPEINCLNLIATKVVRLGTLLNSKVPPKNESVQDSVLDLANYAFLLHCILSEENSTQLNLFKENG